MYERDGKDHKEPKASVRVLLCSLLLSSHSGTSSYLLGVMFLRRHISDVACFCYCFALFFRFLGL